MLNLVGYVLLKAGDSQFTSMLKVLSSLTILRASQTEIFYTKLIDNVRDMSNIISLPQAHYLLNSLNVELILINVLMVTILKNSDTQSISQQKCGTLAVHLFLIVVYILYIFTHVQLLCII